jgi:Uma2 family endonuclease
MPDVMFISNTNLRHLERMQFEGAPDLIVEVVFPDSQTRDRREKPRILKILTGKGIGP